MWRFVVKVVISFYFLFLGVFAHPAQHLTHHLTGKVFQSPLSEHFSALANDEGAIRRAGHPWTRNGRNKAKAIVVEEDDETVSFKRYAETGHTNIAFYGALSYSSICYYFKDRLPFCEHFSYYSADKFIVQRVIRV